MKTKANFTFDKVRFDKENEVHCVVQLKAPKKSFDAKRQQVCVFPVIDVSGSMVGNALDYAKKSALKLVEHLAENDYCGMAVFDSHAELVSKPIRMTAENKETLKKKIGELRAGSSTNFSGGMLIGLNELNSVDLPADAILRVIMLTDGCANAGVHHPDELKNFLKENMGKATVSCFGYGDYANQELMADLAKIGKGNYAFIQNPDDALSAFGKELGGLLSTYAQDIVVEVEANNGHTLDSVVSDVDTEGDDKRITVKLPEILSEENRNIVIKTTLSKQSKALPRALTALNIKISYSLITESGKLEKQVEEIKAKVKFVKHGEEQDKPNKELDEIVAVAQLVKAQIDAEERANYGDYSGAVQIMELTSSNFLDRGLEKYSSLGSKIGTRMKSAQCYSASTSYRTSTKSGGTRSMGIKGMSRDAIEDIGDVFGATTNFTMDNYDKSFNSSDVSDLNVPVTSGRITIVNEPLKKDVSEAVVTENTDKKKSLTKTRSKRW